MSIAYQVIFQTSTYFYAILGGMDFIELNLMRNVYLWIMKGIIKIGLIQPHALVLAHRGTSYKINEPTLTNRIIA